MTEPSVVTYRGRAIDLAPYLEGFPFSGFESLPEANLLLYLHDQPDRRLLKVQPLDRPFDPALGQALGDHDWNRQSQPNGDMEPSRMRGQGQGKACDTQEHHQTKHP